MKSLSELEAIRQKTLAEIEMRKDGSKAVRVVVNMGTCGIAAGARPVMLKFLEELHTRNLRHVTVSLTGCAGLCELEPMLSVYAPGRETVTYVKLTPDMVQRIVEEHIVGGKPVEEYTLDAAEGK